MKYLYGASVQGIQNFIFETNKLKEIIGASELVEDICTTKFQDFAGVKKQNENENWIQGAAGNIKYLFEETEEEVCRRVYYGFPKEVMEYAPGVTISQGLVQVEGPLNIKHFDELERNLKVGRNKPVPFLDFGLMAIRRSLKTGLPSSAESLIHDENPDHGTLAKLKKQGNRYELLAKFIGDNEPEKTNDLFPVDFSEITGKDIKSWLAVIHADGNGLGTVLGKLSLGLQDKPGNYTIKAFRDFSVNLEKSTIKAAREAFNKVFPRKDKRIPFRPVILGGDDLTVIIQAEMALDFASLFLQYFEEETSKMLGGFFKENNININNLTACAGIAYVKESYPFHYSAHMADLLCKDAKKASGIINRDLPPSSLAFYKVQPSFIVAEDFDSIAEHELKTDDFSFKAGPYFLEEFNGYSTIEQLKNWANTIIDKGAPASKLREWISVRYNSKNHADILLERLLQMLGSDDRKKKYIEEFRLNKLKDAKQTPIYDILTIASFLKNE